MEPRTLTSRYSKDPQYTSGVDVPELPPTSGLQPFIAPLHHPMFPSRPTQPPSLSGLVPPSVCQEKCSVLDLLVFNKDFSIFVSMLKLADLIDLLSTEGPVTIFAPTNEAFDGLPTALFKVKINFISRVKTDRNEDICSQ